MFFLKKKKRDYIGLDIGASSIKLVWLDELNGEYSLKHVALAPLPPNAIANNRVVAKDLVAERVSELLQDIALDSVYCNIALPTATAFTRKITLTDVDFNEIPEIIEFEAANYIPHGLEHIHFDYCVTKQLGDSSFEVLIVAVKNDVIESYLDVLSRVGVEPAVVDIDALAVQNAFELSYQDAKDKVNALINIGAQSCSINIVKEGDTLFIGTVSMGGMDLVQEVANKLEIEVGLAVAKVKEFFENKNNDQNSDIMQAFLSYKNDLATEIDRQLRLMWNASGKEEDIEEIFIGGGGAIMDNISQELTIRLGSPVTVINPFSNVRVNSVENKDLVEQLSPMFVTALGLAIRRLGDRGRDGLLIA